MLKARDGQTETLQAEVLLPFPVIPPVISRAKLLLQVMGHKLVIIERKSCSKHAVYVMC